MTGLPDFITLDQGSMGETPAAIWTCARCGGRSGTWFGQDDNTAAAQAEAAEHAGLYHHTPKDDR